MSGSSSRTHLSWSSFPFHSTGRPFISSLSIAQRRSNSATLTGLRPTTRRDESPRRVRLLPEDVRVVGPAVLEPVALGELGQLDQTRVRGVWENGDAEREHVASGIAG